MTGPHTYAMTALALDLDKRHVWEKPSARTRRPFPDFSALVWSTESTVPLRFKIWSCIVCLSVGMIFGDGDRGEIAMSR